MFWDLVEPMALAALDPDDMRDVIDAYHAVVGEKVRGLEEFVAKYVGDGVLA